MKTPWLDGHHVAFGEVIDGMNVVSAIEECGSSDGTPSCVARIVDCGVVEDEDEENENDEGDDNKESGKEEADEGDENDEGDERNDDDEKDKKRDDDERDEIYSDFQMKKKKVKHLRSEEDDSDDFE